MEIKTAQLDQLSRLGLDSEKCKQLSLLLESFPTSLSGEKRWMRLACEFLSPELPFQVHLKLFQWNYENWEGVAPAWIPSTKVIEASNLYQVWKEKGFGSYWELFAWANQNRMEFWEDVVRRLNIHFDVPYGSFVDLSRGGQHPKWWPNAKLNIASSCFQAEGSKTAVLYQPEGGALKRVSYTELDQLSNRVANGLIAAGYKQTDALAIDLPMTLEAVAIYLGIVKMGGVVVSIADSFAPEEIQTRLRISKAKGIFTQDVILRSGKSLPLYEKVIRAKAPPAVVLSCRDQKPRISRKEDMTWDQ